MSFLPFPGDETESHSNNQNENWQELNKVRGRVLAESAEKVFFGFLEKSTVKVIITNIATNRSDGKHVFIKQRYSVSCYI